MLLTSCLVAAILLLDVNRVSAYESVAQQLRMEDAIASQRRVAGSDLTNCPYNKHGLLPFSQIVAQGSPQDVMLPLQSKVLLDSSAEVLTLTVPSGSELIFGDLENLELKASNVVVQGTLSLGAQSCPLLSSGIKLTLTGAPAEAKKGLIISSGGTAEIHGKSFSPTWTRLAESAPSGSRQLSLTDAVDWEVGQKVVIVTTAWNDDPEQHQNEVRQIVSVSASRAEIFLDSALTFGHYGGQEYAAEVALLSRSITLQGDESSEATRYGGHSMCIAGSVCHISGVRAFRMGQENVMGRYPFHFHLMGDIAGSSYIQDSVVEHSFFRAFTLHGTSSARVSRNVAFDVSGSAYYLEDGIEENNIFEFNLAAFVNIIGRLNDYDLGGGQAGVTLRTEANRLLPTDATAAGFYCTNAQNRWIGNSASGGFVGFHFPQVPLALGASAQTHPSYVPEQHGLVEFDSNTAHSSGRHWIAHGSCVYVGGRLWEEQRGQHKYAYISGRYQPARASAQFTFTNLKVFACGKGVLWWGSVWSAGSPDLTLQNFEAHDVRLSSSMLGDTSMVRAVVSCRTGNTFARDTLPSTCEGFELYDTDMQTILSDVTFRGFNQPGDVAIMDMTHSNIYKQQGMFSMKGIHFEDTPFSQRFRHVHRIACVSYHQDTCKNVCSGACAGLSGSSQTSTLVDEDGLAVGWDKGAAILGADDRADETAGETNEWWLLDSSCTHLADWGFYACPTYGKRRVVSLYMMSGLQNSIPPIFYSRVDPEVVDGELYHFGNQERRIRLGLGGSPQITGPCCDIGWYMHLKNGAQKELTIFLDSMVPEEGLIFATSYPQGASFEVQRCMPDCRTVSQGSSLQDVLDAPGTVFYADVEGRLFIKLLHEGNGFFEAGGVRQLQNGNRWESSKGIRYLLRSSLSGSVTFALPPALMSGPTIDAGSGTTTTAPDTDTTTNSIELPTTTPDTGPTIVATTTIDQSSCTAAHRDCRTSKCCQDEGMLCYEKSAWWAACRPSCPSGGWTCLVLSATTTVASTAVATTTSAPSPSSTSTAAATTTTLDAATNTMPVEGYVQPGDTIFLRANAGSGNMLGVEGTAVQARWKERGAWQAFVIQKSSAGPVQSGDTIFLVAHTGAIVDVEGEAVQARWNARDTWQSLIVQKPAGGPILSGDVVCFEAHTGKYVDVAVTPGSNPKARWQECGFWQQFRLDKEDARSLFSGQHVHLTAHTGKVVDVEGEQVQARWVDDGLWQTLKIENLGGRAIFSGDVVFLSAHTGRLIDVESTVVQARYWERGWWQQFIVEKDLGGAIFPGDSIFLRTHTGNYVDVEGTSVRARWPEAGAWQSLVLEVSSKRRLRQSVESALLPGVFESSPLGAMLGASLGLIVGAAASVFFLVRVLWRYDVFLPKQWASVQSGRQTYPVHPSLH